MLQQSRHIVETLQNNLQKVENQGEIHIQNRELTSPQIELPFDEVREIIKIPKNLIPSSPTTEKRKDQNLIFAQKPFRKMDTGKGSQSQLLLGTMPSESNQSTENLITIKISPNPVKENQGSKIKKAQGQEQDAKKSQESSNLHSERNKSNILALQQKYQQNKDANLNFQDKTQDQGSHSDYFDQKSSQNLLDSQEENEKLLNNNQNQRQSEIDKNKLVLEDIHTLDQGTNAQINPNAELIKTDNNSENKVSNQFQEENNSKQLNDNHNHNNNNNNNNNNNQINDEQGRSNIKQQKQGQPEQVQFLPLNSQVPDNNKSNESQPVQNQSIQQAVNNFVQQPPSEPQPQIIREIELVVLFQRYFKNERIVYLQTESFQELEQYEFYLDYPHYKFSKVDPPNLPVEVEKNTIKQIQSMTYYLVQISRYITQNLLLTIIQVGKNNQRRIFQQCQVNFFSDRNLFLRCNPNINYDAQQLIYDQSRATFMIFKLDFVDYLSFLQNQQQNEQQLSSHALKDLHKQTKDLLSFLKFWLMASMNVSFKNSVTDQQSQEYFDQLSFFMNQYWQNQNENIKNAIQQCRQFFNETNCMVEELKRWYDLANNTSKFIDLARMANLFGFEISQKHINDFLNSASDQQVLHKFFQDALSKDQVCIRDNLVIQILQIKSQQIRELTKFQNFLQQNKTIIQSLIRQQQKQQPNRLTASQKWIIDTAKPLLVQSQINRIIKFFEFIKLDFKIILSDFLLCIEQAFSKLNFGTLGEEDEIVILGFLKEQGKDVILNLSVNLLSKIQPLQLIKRTDFTNQLVNLCSNNLKFNEVKYFIDNLYRVCSKQPIVQEQQRNELEEISVSILLSMIFYGWCLNFWDRNQDQIIDLLNQLLNTTYRLLNEESLKQHYISLQEILQREKRKRNNKETNEFIQQVIDRIDQYYVKRVIHKAKGPEKYLNLIQTMTNKNQTLIKGYSKDSIAKALFDQATIIKPFSEDTLFTNEFYPTIVERFRNDDLFQQSSLYMSCKSFAMTYKNQTQITWKKFHNWTSSKKLYQQFLSCFDIKITISSDEEKKLSEVSQRMKNIKKFIELVSEKFQVPFTLPAFQSVSDQEYNNKSIKEILGNKDLGELNEFQDIIEISSYLCQSSLFTQFSREFSQENNLKYVCHNITSSIIPRLYYVYQYLLQLTSNNPSKNIKIIPYPVKFQPYLEETLEICPALKGNYLFYLDKGLILIPTEKVEEEIESLFGIFQKLMDLSNEYKLKNYPLLKLIETSSSMRNFIRLISAIEEQSRKTSLAFPETLKQFLQEISLQKNFQIQNVEHSRYISMHQKISEEFQEFIDFSKVEEKEYQDKIKVLEFIHKIISVDQIVQKYSIETIKEIRLSDQEDVGSAASELLKIIQDLKKNKDKLNFKTILAAYAFCKGYLEELQATPHIIEKINYVSQFTHKLTENLEEFLQNKQQNSQMIMNSFLENGSIEIFYSFKSNEPAYSIQFLVNQNYIFSFSNSKCLYFQNQVTLKNEPNKTIDMNEIYQMQSRLQLFAKGKTISNEQHISDLFIDKKNKFEHFITFAEQIQLVLCELQEIGYLEDQIIKVVVAVKDNGKAIAEMGDLKTDLNNKATEWKQLLIQEKIKNPVLHLIPNRLLRSLASYFVIKYDKLHDDLDDQIVQDKIVKKVNESLIITYQSYQTCEETHINNCFFFLKLLNIDSDNLHLNDNNADQLTSFSYDSETSERAGAIIGVLQDQFQKQTLIIPIDFSGISDVLKIRKVTVSNTEGCLKFLLRFPDISQFQVLFCDEETSNQDIETFISRVRFFRLQNHSKDSDKFFLANFHLLKHFSQQYVFKVATELSSQQTKSPNSLFVIYQVKLKSQKSCLEDKQKQEIWDDFLRIVSDETQYEDTVEVSKQNVFLFYSNKAGKNIEIIEN